MGTTPSSSAGTPALEDVEAAEAAAKEAARAHFAAAQRAKELRVAHVLGSGTEWVPFKATQGDMCRFLECDKASAMDKHAWFLRLVRNRECPGYCIYECDRGCHGWMVADEASANIYLQRLEHGAFTVTSEFKTRFDTVGEETFVFREVDLNCS